MGLSTWSETRIGRLETLYRDGLSFSLIAADIGVTRSAAISKARRMQLPKRVEIIQCKARRAATPRESRCRRSARAVRLDAPERPAVEYIPDRDYCCTIHELKNCSCRYPLWGPAAPHQDQRYCGFPSASVSAGLPYCQRHTVLCCPTHVEMND